MKKIYMQEAIKEAYKAFNEGEIPVGAIIVKDDKIIAKGYNKKEKEKSAIYHAEINAIIEATKKLKNWRLNECDIYVTLFPCPMCASAIHQSRIKNVYYAISCENESMEQITKEIFSSSYNNKPVMYEQIDDGGETLRLLQKFFQKKR